MRSGFTLVETLFSVIIFSLVLLMLFSLVTTARISEQRGEYRQFAEQLAQSRLEEELDRAFGSIPTTSRPGPDVDWQGIRFTTSLEGFRPEPDSTRLKGVRSRVRWNYRGQPYEVDRVGRVSHLTP